MPDFTPDEKRYLTKEKFDELSRELEVLKHDKRKEIADNLEYAKSLGDLSENAEYHEARDAQAALEERIGYIEDVLKHAEIVSKHSADEAGVGAVITVKRDGKGDAITYTLVGSEEADIGKNKISVRSPLGQAAVGKKKGESFSFESPGGVVSYTIISIK